MYQGLNKGLTVRQFLANMTSLCVEKYNKRKVNELVLPNQSPRCLYLIDDPSLIFFLFLEKECEIRAHHEG